MTDSGATPIATEDRIRFAAMKLAAIARNGLTYVRDEFDRERYEQTNEIAAELLSLISDWTVEELAAVLSAEEGYMTPKLDVRGAVFNHEGHVLLIRDRSDEQWTLPGGWADILEPPGLAVEREVQEESGFEVRATKLAAVLDREVQGHLPQFAYHVWKLFFVCRQISVGEPSPVETMEVAWFPVDQLPELSATRILASQIELLHRHWAKPELPTEFD